MYTAMILACFAGQPCMEFTDTRGPYITKEECEVRVEEMVVGLVDAYRVPVIHMQYKCKQDEEEVNKIGA